MSDENKVSIEAERFVGMITAAKLGKDAAEELTFRCEIKTGAKHTFKSAESEGGDWVRLYGDGREIHVRAIMIYCWSTRPEQEQDNSVDVQKMLQQLQAGYSQQQKWATTPIPAAPEYPPTTQPMWISGGTGFSPFGSDYLK